LNALLDYRTTHPYGNLWDGKGGALRPTPDLTKQILRNARDVGALLSLSEPATRDEQHALFVKGAGVLASGIPTQEAGTGYFADAAWNLLLSAGDDENKISIVQSLLRVLIESPEFGAADLENILAQYTPEESDREFARASLKAIEADEKLVYLLNVEHVPKLTRGQLLKRAWGDEMFDQGGLIHSAYLLGTLDTPQVKAFHRFDVDPFSHRDLTGEFRRLVAEFSRKQDPFQRSPIILALERWRSEGRGPVSPDFNFYHGAATELLIDGFGPARGATVGTYESLGVKHYVFETKGSDKSRSQKLDLFFDEAGSRAVLRGRLTEHDPVLLKTLRDRIDAEPGLKGCRILKALVFHENWSIATGKAYPPYVVYVSLPDSGRLQAVILDDQGIQSIRTTSELLLTEFGRLTTLYDDTLVHAPVISQVPPWANQGWFSVLESGDDPA
jgi:hypothetical protein